VSRPGTCLSLVILTEDSGKDARATTEALVRAMLGLVVPGYGRHRVELLPSEPSEEEAMRGNVWKADGKNPRDYERRVRLLKYIARKLCLASTFVVFHVDGDRTWAERDTSENLAKFERLVRTLLPQVADRGRASARRTRRTREADMEPPAPALRVDHLLLFTPFRSVEAWLYQNIQRAIEICRREHGGRHVESLAAWEEKRGDLDELPRPEQEVCLEKGYNLELASRGFPAGTVYDVQKSFAESVDRMRQCTELKAALERTLDAG